VVVFVKITTAGALPTIIWDFAFPMIAVPWSFETSAIAELMTVKQWYSITSVSAKARTAKPWSSKIWVFAARRKALKTLSFIIKSIELY
jgi:hypothetical protein